jgi:hypothetical protein
MFHRAQEYLKAMHYPEELLHQETASGFLLLDQAEFISFNRPTEILVSRHYPGYRIFNLTGKNADEAIGVLLARTLSTDAALESFRVILSTPDIASAIIAKLFPRPAVALKRGTYLVSDKAISAATSEVLGSRLSDENVIGAISHVVTRLLSHMRLVLETTELRTVNVAESLALTFSDMKRVILRESLKDIFSEARISEAASRLNADVTPNMVAEVIATMLRRSALLIPEIRLRLEQLEIVQGLVQHYYRQPHQLTSAMRASQSLATLANYANFLADAVSNKVVGLPHQPNADMREACESVLTILQSAPSLESVPLSRYAEHFGVVPCSALDGLYRGAVVYLPLAQTSRLDVANVAETKSGVEMSLVPAEYTPTTTLSSELNRTLLQPAAMAGLANLVADEVNEIPFGFKDKPLLRTIGVKPVDLVYLAMAFADITAVARADDPAMPFRLVYATKIADQWRERLGAATPTTAYFDSAASLIVYRTGATSQEPKVPAARSQTIDLSSAFDVQYRGDIQKHLQPKVGRPFGFTIEMKNPEESTGYTRLNLTVSPLRLLLGDRPKSFSEKSYYAAVLEPGVDRDLALLFSLVAAYAGGPEAAADKARSWMIETLTPLATHATVVRLAVRALNEAVIAKQLDARRLTSQYKETVVRAYFGTLLGLLMRFNKLDDQLLKAIMAQLPVNSLSVKAALTLASMPMPLDASVLQND